MNSAKQFLALFVCLFSCLPSVSAQEAQSAAAISKEATIIIEQRRVCFTAQKPVQEIRLQVFDHVGELVYDSGAASSQEITWPLQNGNGEELKNGLYAYTLSIKEVGAETARVRRGHFIVDRARDRDGADKLWVTSQNSDGVGAELTVARDENATVAGVSTNIERTVGRSTENSKRDAIGREVEAETQNRSDASKTASAAAAAGTAGKIAKFTTATEVGDSAITELNGNIGIGTNTPLGNLHVHGATGITTTGPGAAFFFRNRETTTNTDYWAWYSQNGVARFWQSGAGDLISVTPSGNVGIGTINLTSSRLTIEGQDALSVRGYEPLITFIDGNNRNARGVIQQVNGGLNLFTDAYLRGANPFGYLRLDTSGNVGIGVANPTSKLEIVGQDGLAITGYQPFITLRDTNTGGLLSRMAGGNGDLGFYPNSFIGNVPAVLIKNGSGNLGIGTSNPTSKLQVEGAGIIEVAINSRNERAILALGNTLSAGRYVWTLESGVRGIPGSFGIYNRVTNRSGLEIDGSGVVSVRALQITGGADLSEKFDVMAGKNPASAEEVQPGMVVAIDPVNPGKLRLTRRAYDRHVAGVISGAGGVQPGMTMGQEGTLADGKHPVALGGRVYVWVDATRGAVKPGDLLTTSATPGHAMKAANTSKAQGAIIGKAMTGLKRGKGLVLTLVTLR